MEVVPTLLRRRTPVLPTPLIVRFLATYNKKEVLEDELQYFFLAGVLGIEPRLKALETHVIPFHHTPVSKRSDYSDLLLLRFDEKNVRPHGWIKLLQFKLSTFVVLVALGAEAVGADALVFRDHPDPGASAFFWHVWVVYL